MAVGAALGGLEGDFHLTEIRAARGIPCDEGFHRGGEGLGGGGAESCAEMVDAVDSVLLGGTLEEG